MMNTDTQIASGLHNEYVTGEEINLPQGILP